MSSTLKNKLEELDLTTDELRRFSEAFKKEEFKQLFAEYANEISDPANKALYEEEIRQLEKERGMEVKFIHPEPGYVLKTSAEGVTKTFINVCISSQVGSPTSERKTGVDGKIGLLWSIPHLFSQPREDFAKGGNKCMVYDFIIHPHTYRMAEANLQFRKMINNLAIDGLQKMFNLSLDQGNCKQIRMKYKGHLTCSVIRNRISHEKTSQDDILSRFPYPYGDYTSAEKAERMAQECALKGPSKDAKSTLEMDEYVNYTTPKYELRYQADVDLQHHLQCQKLVTSTRPQRLIVEIFLPLLSSASSINLDVFERSIKLLSHMPAKYHLGIKLPYSVDENASKAKFDKFKHKLSITLVILSNECLVSDAWDLGAKSLKDSNFSEPASDHEEKEILEQREETEIAGNGENVNKEKKIYKNSGVNDAADCYEEKETIEKKGIVVIHEKENPKLHGILKLRSFSDSSDDHFSTSFEQLTSGEEVDTEFGETNRVCYSLPSSFGTKKSVSFNDRVDRTVFQTNQSVSSLHATLKNKKKKIKKKERRFECQKLRQNLKKSGNSSSCESAPEEAIGDPKETETTKGDLLSTSCSSDSGIDQFQKESIVEKNVSSIVSNPEGCPEKPHEVTDTILSWSDGNVLRNVLCPIKLENNYTFSLDIV